MSANIKGKSPFLGLPSADPIFFRKEHRHRDHSKEYQCSCIVIIKLVHIRRVSIQPNKLFFNVFMPKPLSNTIGSS